MLHCPEGFRPHDATRLAPAPVECLWRNTGLNHELFILSSKHCNFMSRYTTCSVSRPWASTRYGVIFGLSGLREGAPDCHGWARGRVSGWECEWPREEVRSACFKCGSGALEAPETRGGSGAVLMGCSDPPRHPLSSVNPARPARRTYSMRSAERGMRSSGLRSFFQNMRNPLQIRSIRFK